MSKRVYAEDTTVSVERTQSEIRQNLKSIGAGTYAVFERADTVDIAFEVNGTAYRISRPALPEIKGKSEAQRERSAWRALGLLIKAKRVAVEQGITTVEREFFADTMLQGGRRLIEHRQQIIEHAYENGPPLIGFTPQDATE